MTAKESLVRVEWLENEAKRAEERAELLRADIERITVSYDSVHVQGGQSSQEALIIRLDDAESKARDARTRATIYRDRALELINLLDDKRWRDILKLRYISLIKDWDAIAQELSFSRRHAIRLHRQALYHFSLIMPPEWRQ
jgi:hypothetical protein